MPFSNCYVEMWKRGTKIKSKTMNKKKYNGYFEKVNEAIEEAKSRTRIDWKDIPDDELFPSKRIAKAEPMTYFNSTFDPEPFIIKNRPDFEEPWIDKKEPVFNEVKHKETCAKNRKKRKKRNRRK